MPEKVEDKGTPEEKPELVQDTLANALDTTERTFDGKPVKEDESILSGHPAEEPGEPEPKPEEEPSSEVEGSPEPDKTFKYKDQEEAEAAALEGQRYATRLNLELQETNALLLRTLAGQRGEQPSGTTEAPAAEDPAEFVKQRRKEVLDEIEKLDPNDEDYKGRVADAQAKADADISKHYQGIQDASRKAEDERLKGERDEEQRQNESTQAVIDQAETAMKDAGLDASPKSKDSILFWALTQTTPRQKNGVPLSIAEQIQLTINETKTYKTEALETYKTEEARKLAEQRQNEDQPLDRGAVGPVTAKETIPEAVKPATLGSVINAVMESRRI